MTEAAGGGEGRTVGGARGGGGRSVGGAAAPGGGGSTVAEATATAPSAGVELAFSELADSVGAGVSGSSSPRL